MSDIPVNQPIIYKTSWFGYAKIILIILFIMAFLFLVIENLEQINATLALIGKILFILAICYFALVLRRYIVYKVEVNDDGVWVHSGVLPWEKRSYGLNWRDISDAVYRTGFISWLTRSHQVHVRHRYTKESELALYDIAKGNELVARINEQIKTRNLY